MTKRIRPLKPVREEPVDWEDTPAWISCPALRRGLRNMAIAFTLAGGAAVSIIVPTRHELMGVMRQPSLTRAKREAEIEAEISKMESPATSEKNTQPDDPAEK